MLLGLLTTVSTIGSVVASECSTRGCSTNGHVLLQSKGIVASHLSEGRKGEQGNNTDLSLTRSSAPETGCKHTLDEKILTLGALRTFLTDLNLDDDALERVASYVDGGVLRESYRVQANMAADVPDLQSLLRGESAQGKSLVVARADWDFLNKAASDPGDWTELVLPEARNNKTLDFLSSCAFVAEMCPSAVRDSRFVVNFFGDGVWDCKIPTFSKCRPINRSLGHHVLLRLNAHRLWGQAQTLWDNPSLDIPFKDKVDKLVWRGNLFVGEPWFRPGIGYKVSEQPYQDDLLPNRSRLLLLDKYARGADNRIDVGAVTGSTRQDIESACDQRLPGYNCSRLVKEPIDMEQQLMNKFIFAIEGNDISSGIQWMLASNSAVFMPKPTDESWLLEGRLKPWVHYVPVADDFSDLSQKVSWAIAHSEATEAIAMAGKMYVADFKDAEREQRIAAGVILTYNARVKLY